MRFSSPGARARTWVACLLRLFPDVARPGRGRCFSFLTIRLIWADVLLRIFLTVLIAGQLAELIFLTLYIPHFVHADYINGTALLQIALLGTFGVIGLLLSAHCRPKWRVIPAVASSANFLMLLLTAIDAASGSNGSEFFFWWVYANSVFCLNAFFILPQFVRSWLDSRSALYIVAPTSETRIGNGLDKYSAMRLLWMCTIGSYVALSLPYSLYHDMSPANLRLLVELFSMGLLGINVVGLLVLGPSLGDASNSVQVSPEHSEQRDESV